MSLHTDAAYDEAKRTTLELSRRNVVAKFRRAYGGSAPSVLDRLFYFVDDNRRPATKDAPSGKDSGAQCRWY